MAYSVGHLSGAHFNPAVSIGLWAGGRFPARDLLPYMVTQVIAASVAAWALYLIATGATGFDLTTTGLGQNGYASQSPGGLSIVAVAAAEAIMTFFFLIVIMGSTHQKAPAGFAPISIGLALTLNHLISIPISNTSVNPARSTGPALIAGGMALEQLWLFWLAPSIGGLAGGFTYKILSPDSHAAPDVVARRAHRPENQPSLQRKRNTLTCVSSTAAPSRLLNLQAILHVSQSRSPRCLVA